MAFHVYTVASRDKKSEGHWLRPVRKTEQEDIRRYIRVHGKILRSPPPPPSANPPGYGSGKQATVRQLWALPDTLEEGGRKGGREKTRAPASRYTKGVRKKVPISNLEEEEINRKGNCGRQSQSVRERPRDVAERPIDEVVVPKLHRKMGKDGEIRVACLRPREEVGKAKPIGPRSSTSPPLCPTHVHRSPHGSPPVTGREWLSSRSPKRSPITTNRQPLIPINTRTPSRDVPHCGTALGSCKPEKSRRTGDQERSRPATKRPKLALQEEPELTLLPSHTRQSGCGGTSDGSADLAGSSMSVFLHPDQPLPDLGVRELEEAVGSSLPFLPDSPESSDLAWLDAGLPTEYKLPSPKSSDLECDTNELLEELSSCERMLATSL